MNYPPRTPTGITNWREAYNNLQWLDQMRRCQQPRDMTEDDEANLKKVMAKTLKTATRETAVTALCVLKEAAQQNVGLRRLLDEKVGGLEWLDIATEELRKEFHSLKGQP